MKYSEVILKVTDFPMKSFYEMPFWGKSLIKKLIKLYEKYEIKSQEFSSRQPRGFLFKMYSF